MPAARIREEIRMKRDIRKLVVVMASTMLLAATLGVGTASSKVTCAGKSDGGEWRSFGHDDANTRSQPLEKAITPETAPLLLPKWHFSITGGGGGGNFQSTPVIADGCLYA